MLTPEIKACISKSVLCWLATSSVENIPNVSPKEIFVPYGDDKILIANIASPQSVSNIQQNGNVCLSFIDIFVQKGFQLKGFAKIISKVDPDFGEKAIPLIAKAGENFPIASIIEMQVTSSRRILAPSYLFFKETQETDQIASAMNTYGVRPK